MIKKIDFNCDMGESFGIHKLGLDEEVIKHITSANIACGFHAGDPMWIRHTVKLAEGQNVAIGAHPSFPDLMGFGRRNMNLSENEIINYIIYQTGALMAFTKDKKLQHIKPHGAMYNMAVSDKIIARAICRAVMEIDRELILVVLAGSPWEHVAMEMGVRISREAFADRAVNSDGSLVDRALPGSMIEDPDDVAERSLQIVTTGMATTISGQDIPIKADTLCLHGDTPGTVQIASKVRTKLTQAGIEIAPMGSFL